MKINHMELKKIIEYVPFEQISQKKRKCPTPKNLVSLQRSELSDKKRRKVIDHLVVCSTCAKEIQFINEVLAAEKNFDKEAAQIVTNRNPASRKRGTIVKSPFPKLSWRSLSVVAALTTIILFSSIFFLNKTNKTAIERDSSFHLNLISPDNISRTLSELYFEWNNIPETEYNIVVISDDSSKIVWRSEKILHNKLIPSAELKELLKREKTYLWMVTAYLKSGRQIESNLAKFIVK